MGAPQMTGINGTDGLTRQGLGQAVDLPAAFGVEFDVELPLDAGIDIPGGFAVANGNDAGGVHGVLSDLKALMSLRYCYKQKSNKHSIYRG